MDTLQWNITPQEQKTERAQLLKIQIPLILVVLLAVFWKIDVPSIIVRNSIHRSSANIINSFLFVLGAVLLIAIILYVTNKYKNYDNRDYALDTNSVTVTMGKKTNQYQWTDFECYYEHQWYFANNNPNRQDKISKSFSEMANNEQSITGKTFYLKKKPTGFIDKVRKTFLVIHTAPNNMNYVDEFLKVHLQKQPFTQSTEMGLIKYEYK